MFTRGSRLFFGLATASLLGAMLYGIITNGLAGQFSSLRCDAAAGPSRETIALTTGEAGTVAVVQDEGNRVAPGLATAFREAGFGVTADAFSSAAWEVPGLDAAQVALSRGFKTVYWFRGGMPEWERNGLALDTSKPSPDRIAAAAPAPTAVATTKR